MPKKNKTIEKTFQFNCSTCQKIYQLIETHYLAKFNPFDINFSTNKCSSDCQNKWQTILHEYYQEKVLGYIQKQEEEKFSAEQEEEESEEN